MATSVFVSVFASACFRGGVIVVILTPRVRWFVSSDVSLVDVVFDKICSQFLISSRHPKTQCFINCLKK